MERNVQLYVDDILRAGDILLAAEIRVVGYDLYPGGAGALLVSINDRERAFVLLKSDGIKFTDRPVARGGHLGSRLGNHCR